MMIFTDQSRYCHAERSEASVCPSRETLRSAQGDNTFPILVGKNHYAKCVQREGVEMKKRQDDFEVVPFPKIRRGIAITYRSVQRKPMTHGLIEVDVTKARQYLREHKAKIGESLSFTAFITACVAQAVDENKSLHAYRKGGKQLVLFDEVDVATVVEREMAGQQQPIIYVIRAANKKTFREIHQEIRAAQVEQAKKAWEGFQALNWLLFVPVVVFKCWWWVFCWMRRRNPEVQKKYGGTVGISAVGMFGKGGGWGIPVNDHTLDITLGGIVEKPGIVDGHIAIREYLCMTLSMDHDIIDGAPAARFTTRLKELIESGYGLYESEAEGYVIAR
jgi:pyruvate/2-oxoglutarate dehydrogenase complex dihydrolipoamide acyltransferase (E2) component